MKGTTGNKFAKLATTLTAFGQRLVRKFLQRFFNRATLRALIFVKGHKKKLSVRSVQFVSFSNGAHVGLAEK